MSATRVSPDGLRLLEDALYCAIHLIAAMDESVGHGNAIVIPEVILWAIVKSIPSLSSAEADSHGELVRLLSHYCTLRGLAEEERRERYLDGIGSGDDWGDDHGYLTPENTLHALTSGKWDCPEPELKDTIARVLQTVVERNERNIWADSRFPIEHSWAPSAAPYGFKSESSVTLDRESATILSTALNHGFTQLIACDDGYDLDFWEKVYSFAISDWLESDLPDIANEIIARSLTASYFSCISAFVLRMCEIEAIYRRIGYPVCFYLLRTRDEEPLSVANDLRVRRYPFFLNEPCHSSPDTQGFVRANSRLISTDDEDAIRVKLNVVNYLTVAIQQQLGDGTTIQLHL